MGTERMMPRNTYHQPFMVKFSEKCEWHKEVKPDINTELV
jgi:hypothetical protein